MTATAINLAAKQELRDSCGLTDEEQGVVWPAGEQITDAQAEEMAKCAALMGAAMRETAINWADMPLFAGRTSGLPYQKHSRTSILAAGRAAGGAETARERVFQAIAAAPNGITDMEIQEALNMSGDTERPRRIELLDAGRIQAVGFRAVKRPGKRDRVATAWGVA
jgi:hypothetical protein